MTIRPAAAIAVAMLATSCAEPAHSWQPTEPAFGADQAISQNAFCGVIFDGLAGYAEDPEDKAILLRLSKATADHIRQIGVKADDPAVTDGIRHAVAYSIGANDEQMVAAANRCVDVVGIGEWHK